MTPRPRMLVLGDASRPVRRRGLRLRELAELAEQHVSQVTGPAFRAGVGVAVEQHAEPCAEA